MVELDRLRAGPPLPASTVTVGELLDRWLDTKAGLSAAGQKACRLAARRVRRTWGDVLAVDVRRTDVAAWVANLQARPTGGDVRGAAASTKAKSLQALSGALDVGIDLRLIDTNPCSKIRVGRVEANDTVVLTVTELRALAVATGPDSGALIWVLGTTGPRIGEAAALNVGDVDWRRRRLRIRKSKNGEARDVPIAESVLKMLDFNRPAREPLFVGPRGGRLYPNSWRRWRFDRAKMKIGRPDITPHALRHTAASLAIAAGADVKQVQYMMGHKSAVMTLDLYGHLWPSGLDDIAVRIENLVCA